MSFLQNFGLELLKIMFLAAVYAFVIYSLRFLASSRMRQQWFRHIKYWQICLLTGGALTAFSYTYYGNHGLDGGHYLPLGHHKTMFAADDYAFFRTSDFTRAISVDSFLVRRDTLCMGSGGAYFVYKLPTGEMKKFDDKSSYQQYASQHALPGVENLLDFKSQYNRYWHGWRRWILP
jgi:hypothetical protein